MKFAALTFLLLALEASAAITPEQTEFFEKRIRPVLAQECYECHSSTGKRKGGLALDCRPAWQEGGDSGATIVPGNVKESLLLRTIRHEDEDLKMPRNGAKLEAAVIHDFEHWIEMGAPDPRDQPPTPEEVAKDKQWSAVLQRRKSWWSFQPISHPAVPETKAPDWSANPVDRFLRDKMEQSGLEPAAEAEPRLVLRRLSYVLTGLAPTPEETDAFQHEAEVDPQKAVDAAADRLMASPRFGETWARHWMDWVRYAETHGSEGDPQIPWAWRYRDYLIRALNADVPFPQLLREHIAGDLLAQPRLNEELGIDESALGAAHFRMVMHGFTPTDPLDEECTFTDNQIDTVSKAFLGLTVACARCHDHKFDAISQTDYYSLFGIFASSRPATVDVNLPARQAAGESELVALKGKIREEMARAWLAKIDEAPAKLAAWKLPDEKAKAAWMMEETGPFAAWLALKDLPAEKWPAAWQRLRERWADAQDRLEKFRTQSTPVRWDLRGPDFGQWESSGAGVAQGPTAAGEFAVAHDDAHAIEGIYPAGVYSHLLSQRQRGLLASPSFTAQEGKLWVRVRGGGAARARYAVRNYPRTGTVYPKLELDSPEDRWIGWDLKYWKGDELHVEISTEEDQPVETTHHDHSWFGVSDVVYAPNADAVPPTPGASLVAFAGEPAPASVEALGQMYAGALRQCVEHWAAGTMSDLEAEFLRSAIGLDLLPNRVAELPEVAPLLAEYRKGELALAEPTRAPGLLEGFAFDQPLFVRGDHKHPADPVPRRFLEALDPRPYQPGERQSGRLQLAESLVGPNNPLTPRVIVNRLWLYVFGQGIVSTPDNFGRLGELPSHPELLDYLAGQFAQEGGSIKGFLRMLVTSREFRLSSTPSAQAAEIDPENRLLSHFTLRRLDAEAIRDSMLAVSGKLVEMGGGQSTDENATRRSIYERVIRNSLDPLLTAFDFPVPTAPRGKRDSTNVPAQALALLNNPMVANWAEHWAIRVFRTTPDSEGRVRQMFREAFGRDPQAAEMQASLAYLRQGAETAVLDPGSPSPIPIEAWHNLAVALFNAKEFLYLR